MLRVALAAFHETQSNADLIEDEQGHAYVQQESTGHTPCAGVIRLAEDLRAQIAGEDF